MKPFVLVALVVLMIGSVFFIVSCDIDTPICGDGVCSTQEAALDSCPDDCVNPNCQYLWWFDNDQTSCKEKKFCGTYMYQGLRTFDTEEECMAALTLTCTDSDGGKEYYIKGTVKDNDQEVADWCESSTKLVENYCNGNVLGNGYYDCSNGCEDGACKEAVECAAPNTPTCTAAGSTVESFTDSNGCINYVCVPAPSVSCSGNTEIQPYTKGTITGIGADGKGYTSEDECESDSVLIERVCEGAIGAMVKVPCENGCASGVCSQ